MAEVASRDAVKVLDQQIAADGELPQEEVRASSLFYTGFDLHALLALAHLSARSGEDLWGHVTPNGAGIPAALDYMAPFALGNRAWNRSQDADGFAFTYDMLFDCYRAAALNYATGAPPDRRNATRAAGFAFVADHTVNATAVDDVHRLLWPFPLPQGCA